jgi:hypothetical protein
MSSIYHLGYREKQDLTVFQQAGEWIKNNPTTVKAAARAGILFGGILIVLATSPLLGGAATLSLLCVGAIFSLIATVTEVYADDHFQKMCQEQGAFNNRSAYSWSDRYSSC